MELKKIFKGGAYIIGILLLANLVEVLIPIPPKYNPFASSDWITLLWHSTMAVLLAAITGYLTGLLAHFIYVIEGGGKFDPNDKKKSYEHAYTAFFISLGILLAASLCGASEFQTILIYNGVIVFIIGVLVFVLPKIFGSGIDQGGTASLRLHDHTTQAPPQPKNQQPPAQQPPVQNNTPRTGLPGWAFALIVIFALVILSRIFGNGQQNNVQNTPNVTNTPQPGQQSNQGQGQQLTGTPPALQQQTVPPTNASGQQTGPHSKFLGR